jgi:hypothetical protein
MLMVYEQVNQLIMTLWVDGDVLEEKWWYADCKTMK